MSGFTLRSHSLDAYWDAIVRGDAHPNASGLPADQAETVQWFQRLSTPVPDAQRDRAWEELRHRIANPPTKEQRQMYQSVAMAPPRMPERFLPTPRLSRQRAMAWVSIAVLLALLGGLAYGILFRRDGSEPSLPAVQHMQTDAPLGTPWPQFRGGSERTGSTSDPGPSADLSERWSFTADGDLNGVVEDEGRVFVSGRDGELYALDAATGAQLWGIDLSEGQFDSIGSYPVPAVGDGVVVLPAATGALVVLDAENGELIWSHADADYSAVSATIDDGLVWAVDSGMMLIAFDLKTGEQQHDLELASPLAGPPTFTDAAIYAVLNDGKVIGWDKANGEVMWLTEALPAHRVGAYFEGQLFVPGPGGEVTAFDAGSGALQWQVDLGDGEAQALAVAEQGIVVSLPGQGVVAIDRSSGEEQWRVDVTSLVNPAYVGGTTVYATTSGESLVALDLESGEELASATVESAGSNAAISGEMLFLGGQRGTVWAFGPGTDASLSNVAASPIALALPTEVVETTVSAPSAEQEMSGQIQLELESVTEYQGTFGFQPGPLGTMWRFTASGDIEILDRDGNVLETRTYGIGSDPGTFSWLVDVNEPPQMIWANAMAVFLDDGASWVNDVSNARIQILDQAGAVTGQIGARGDADGQFKAPVWLTRAPNGEILVVDMWRGDLQWFSQDGTFLRSFTGPAERPFVRPIAAEYDSQGNLWVLDFISPTVSKFDADLNLVFSIGGQNGKTPGSQLPEPSSIAIDEQDRVWVTGQTPGRLDVFDNNGNLLGTFDACATELNCFDRVGILVIGGNDYLYVLDYDGAGFDPDRLMKFRIVSIPDIPIMSAATPAAG